jgi:hypothetical protein
MELTPRPNPPDGTRVRRIVLTIGGRRYEFIQRWEHREITSGPAKVIAMPEKKRRPSS